MLTRKQHALLLFIYEHLQETGVSPSFDEMREALALKSKSGVHRLVSALEERGFLRRLAHRARALEVVKMPENIHPETLPIRSRRMALADRDNSETAWAANTNVPVSLPLWGRIAAGTPIEAIGDDNERIEVPSSFVGRGEYYALEVEGDSMVEAGIMDSDTVIIEKTEHARNGDIVVAFLARDNEATLKRFEQNGDIIILHPANKHYKTRQFAAAEVKVQGKLTALLRRY